MNAAGSNLVIAGRAGFALYSGSRRKWKLFGNEVQEQSLVCRGGVLWYQDIVVFPCRVQEHSEEVWGCVCVGVEGAYDILYQSAYMYKVYKVLIS